MAQATQAELQAILHGTAVAPLGAPGYEVFARAFLSITGPDATRWLNGMVTNSVQALAPGEGNYNFLLNAQGRIQGDCTIYRELDEGEHTFLLETDRSQLTRVQETLDRLIIMDDVEMNPRGFEDQLFLLGPEVPGLIRSFSATVAEHLFSTQSRSPRLDESLPGEIYTAVHVGEVPVVELASNFTTSTCFLEQMKTAGATEVSPAALEAFRIYSGTPRYGTDIRNSDTARDLPQETNQTHALHFSKGCYLGQEIVERIRSRGQVHKLFTRFRLLGNLPASLPALLQVDGKAAGELTSTAMVPLPDGPELLALGYARREFLDLRKQFTYAGGTATAAPHPNMS